MLTKADDYPIHQTPEPIAQAGGDRNFYDRYFFNGYSPDGEVFFAAALGVYPQLGIMDAAFGIRIGNRQYNLHTSRYLGSERTDTQVGPIRVEVIEPLQKLRIIVEDNEHGIAADLVFDGRCAPFEEPRTTRRTGTRVFMDSTRMTQLGDYSGRVSAGGQTITFEPGQLLGTRDRSWGIRNVGERDPQPQAPPIVPQFHWYWVPAIVEDRAVLFYMNQDEHGEVWNTGMVIARDGEEAKHLKGATIEAPLIPGTRWPSSATITAPSGSGGAYRIELAPQRRFYMSGIGYMNPDWGHGVNKGTLAVGYDEVATDDVTRHEPPWLHVQAFTTVSLTTPDGETLSGVGALETLSMGPHGPLGLEGLYDAP